MNALHISIAILSLLVLSQEVDALRFIRRIRRVHGYSYVTRCKSQTEKCVSLRCGRRRAVTVPFSYNYLCCRGSLYNQMKYVCVRYNYGSHSRIVLEHCNPCRQFKCENGECTKKQWKCNNIKDCADGSDEVGCPKCRRRKYLFACRKGRKCIYKSRVCDKVNNCPDGSDEVGCPTPLGNKCGPHQYRCKNNKCIYWTACNVLIIRRLV
ncbi:very low-density lipoprotein receptor-like [Xenia sp. Carnegie-2017]|uniref:very low-density lipoprotein receptor-like n=1 Tax=Xenia sp. Carnegie-2017 TaxID=2897299 RepID=UPI001F0401B7|nr:very low-density lipoprotein receptor-like [Xenia sp. Carnegie-2017]